MKRPSDTRLQELLHLAREGERTLIMGVLNTTPDSFSDGGEFLTAENALKQAERMVEDGADIIDVGGESTRPSTFSTHSPLDSSVEMERILPVIAQISARFPSTPISVDTYKADVAAAAIEAGANMVNDISAMRYDPIMLPLVVKYNLPVCLMHTPGLPTSIPEKPIYTNVVSEVLSHLLSRASDAESSGMNRRNIIIDPGIGFGKSLDENLALLRNLELFTRSPYLTLIGTSRKSFIGKILGDLPPNQRIEGTAATVAVAIQNGVGIVRVHDVLEMSRVVRVTDAITRGHH